MPKEIKTTQKFTKELIAKIHKTQPLHPGDTLISRRGERFTVSKVTSTIIDIVGAAKGKVFTIYISAPIKENTYHTINAVNNRKLVFQDNTMVGFIDYHPGTPELIKNSTDKYLAYVEATYRDGKLKINRTTPRKIGEYKTLDMALQAIKVAVDGGATKSKK